MALLLFAQRWLQALPLALLLGTATAAIGFNIMHDGGHQAYSERRWVDRLMALALDLVGGSSYICQWKHTPFHPNWVTVARHELDNALGMIAGLRHRHHRQPGT